MAVSFDHHNTIEHSLLLRKIMNRKKKNNYCPAVMWNCSRGYGHYDDAVYELEQSDREIVLHIDCALHQLTGSHAVYKWIRNN